jgi:hypothetical protein
MFVWTGSESESVDTPTFSVTAVLVARPVDAPALLKQAPFRWQEDAWQATVRVLRIPSVAEAWRRLRVIPQREAATHLHSAMRMDAAQSDLGVVTFRALGS